MHSAACSCKALGVNLGDSKNHGTNSRARSCPEIFITSLLSNDCFNSISPGLRGLSSEACSPGIRRKHTFAKSGTCLQSLRLVIGGNYHSFSRSPTFKKKKKSQRGELRELSWKEIPALGGCLKLEAIATDLLLSYQVSSNPTTLENSHKPFESRHYYPFIGVL